MYLLRHLSGKVNWRLTYLLACNIQGIEYNQRNSMRLSIERTCYSFSAALEYASKLVHGDHVIVPRKLVGARRGGSGSEIVEVCTQGKRPCVVETLKWIRPAAEPL